MSIKSIFILFLLIFVSCSSNSKYKKEKKSNIVAECINRKSDEYSYLMKPFVKRQMKQYPFEKGNVGNLFKITKEFFRCKGSPLNPERLDENDPMNIKVYLDCEGSSKHSLPLIDGKEGVYPILLDVLNYLQRKTKRKVVITCGHRCPKHNNYADILKNAKASKHMIGAEVDFYVQGFENRALDIVDLIMQFYKEKPKYKGKLEFEDFQRYEKDTDVSIKPWYNKEIFMKVYHKNEGRDFSNRHPYQYISLQVRWDRNKNEKVIYNWNKAHQGYLRW